MKKLFYLLACLCLGFLLIPKAAGQENLILRRHAVQKKLIRAEQEQNLSFNDLKATIEFKKGSIVKKYWKEFLQAKRNIVLENEADLPEVEVSVEEVDVNAPLSYRMHRCGKVYNLEPDGMVFSEPVLLTLPYENTSGYSEDYINIFYLDPKTKEWYMMPKVSQDTQAKTITIRTNHFSTYTANIENPLVEGLTPNIQYIQNNDEIVDPYSGCLQIQTTDVVLKGRGIDLPFGRTFNSESYFTQNAYKILISGWRYMFPYITKYFGSLNRSPSEVEHDHYFFHTSSGTTFDISEIVKSSFPHEHLYEKHFYFDFVWYDMVDTNNITYRIIEYANGKCIIKGRMVDTGWWNYSFLDVTLYDHINSKKYQFDNDGYPVRVSDIAGINAFTIEYYLTVKDGKTINKGKINRIVDPANKVYTFEYSTDRITVSHTTNGLKKKLVQYVIRGYPMGESVDFDNPIPNYKLKNVIYGDSQTQEIQYNYGTSLIEIISPLKARKTYDFGYFNPSFYNSLTGVEYPVLSIRERFGLSDTPKDKYTEFRPTYFSWFVLPNVPNVPSTACVIIHRTYDSTIITAREDIHFQVYEQNSFGNTIYKLIGEGAREHFIWKNNTWEQDKKTLYHYVKLAGDDRYRLDDVSVYINDFSTPKYSLSYFWDHSGLLLAEKDANGTWTHYKYLSGTFYTCPELSNDPYTANNLKSLLLGYGVVCGVRRKQSDLVYQEQYILYDGVRNPVCISNRNVSSNGQFVGWVNTNYVYDPATNLCIKTIDANGNTKLFEYSARGYLARIITPLNPGIYVAEDNLMARSVSEFFSYDSLGNLISKSLLFTTTSDGVVGNQYGYYVIPSSISDTLRINYDDLNRITSIQRVNKNNSADVQTIKTIVYDGKTMTITEPNGLKTRQTYDGCGNLIYSAKVRVGYIPYTSNPIDFEVSETQIVYHPIFMDKPAQIVVHSSGVPDLTTNFTYDQLGREIQRTINGKIVLKRTFVENENKVVEYYYKDDAACSMKVLDYDWKNQLSYVLEYEDHTQTNTPRTYTHFSYDAAGNLVSKVVAPDEVNSTSIQNGILFQSLQSFTNSINSLGQTDKITYYDGSTEYFVYDGVNNLKIYANRDGKEIHYTYDSWNKVRTLEEYSSAGVKQNTSSFTYSAFGTVSSVTKTNNLTNTVEFVTQYTCNSMGKLWKVRQSMDDRIYETEKTYDAGMNLDTLTLRTLNASNAVLYQKKLDYDPVIETPFVPEQLNNQYYTSQVKDDLGNVLFKAVKNYNGNPMSLVYGADVLTQTLTYDSFLRVNNLNTRNAAGPIENLSWTYDYQNNITSFTETNGVSPAPLTSWNNIRYDGYGRLASFDDLTIGRNFTYTYDLFGNRTSVKKTRLGPYGETTVYNYQYDSWKKIRLISAQTEKGLVNNIVYDFSGQTLSRDVNGTHWDYAYNVSGLLTEIKKNGIVFEKNTYNCLGLRIRKEDDANVTYYLYEGQNLLLEEKLDKNTRQNLLREFNVFAGGQNLAKYTQTGTNPEKLEYHLLDHLGTRRAVTDSAGNITQRLTYTPWGETADNANASFTGKQQDTGTGLQCFNARYYDPSLGRFLSEDPAMQGNNWYAYCLNNPLNYIDTDGMNADALLATADTLRNIATEIAICDPTGPSIPDFEIAAAGIYAAAAVVTVVAGVVSILDMIHQSSTIEIGSLDNPMENVDETKTISDTDTVYKNKKDNKCGKGNMRRLSKEEIMRRTGTSVHDVKKSIINDFGKEIKKAKLSKNFDLYEDCDGLILKSNEGGRELKLKLQLENFGM